MVELGELEKRHAEFEKRKVSIIAISNDDVGLAKETQQKFPHLTIVSDADQNMAKAIQVIHKGAGPSGADINAPTTFIVDGGGSVRWMFRADRFMERLSPDALLNAIDKNDLTPLPNSTSRTLPD